MKGIILAGGAGSRLYPLTKVTTKQLQPIYNKPMIYYPLSLLMLVGITEILIITTINDKPQFEQLLGSGERFGIKISFAVQDSPNGIAEAYIIAENFLQKENSIMVLGDNLFHGNFNIFREATQLQNKLNKGAQIFAYQVLDPERYGVIDFDKNTKKALSIEEKPLKPKTNYAIPGLYILDGTAPEKAKNQTPSPRGELEITDLIKLYMQEDELSVQLIGRGMAWLDTGTPESLHEASTYIASIEQRQGFKVACLEEIGLRMNYLTLNQYKDIVAQTPNGPYRKYLEIIVHEYEKND